MPNSHFKHLDQVFLVDSMFKKMQAKLVSIIQEDWRMGEETEPQASKYTNILRINNDVLD